MFRRYMFKNKNYLKCAKYMTKNKSPKTKNIYENLRALKKNSFYTTVPLLRLEFKMIIF